MHKHYAVKNKGITLVETIVSILLLTISIGAMLGAFLIGKISVARAKHRISAINLARDKIEAIKGLSYAQIPSQAGSESVTIDQGTPLSGDELAGQRATTVSDAHGDSRQYKIATTVTWAEKGATNLQETIVTLISQH